MEAPNLTKTLVGSFAAALTLDVGLSMGIKTLSWVFSSIDSLFAGTTTEENMETSSLNTIAFKGFNILQTILPGAFTAYTLRSCAREYKHAWFGGIIGGAIKYLAKGSTVHTGIYNNLAYELGKDSLSIISSLPTIITDTVRSLQPPIIEGMEESYNSYSNNSSIGMGLGEGIMIGGTLDLIDKLALTPIITKLILPREFGIYEEIGIYASTFALTVFTAYQTYNNFNLEKTIEYLNFGHTILADGLYSVINRGYIAGNNAFYYRITQRAESSEKKVNKNYLKSIPDNDVKIDIELHDSKDICDFSSSFVAGSIYTQQGMTLVNGVKLIKSYILRADEDNRFGEFSGIIFDDQENLILISDRSSYVKTTPQFENGALTSLNVSTIGNIRDKNKLPSTHGTDKTDILYYSKEFYDVEEAVFHNGNCILSHEKINEFSVYEGCNFQGGNRRSLAAPKEIKHLPSNDGIEAFGFSPKEKQFLAVSEYGADEKTKNSGMHEAYKWKTSEAYDKVLESIKFHYQSTPGLGVSGLTFLSNGNMLVLERKYVKKAFSCAEDYWVKVQLVEAGALENLNEKSIVSSNKTLIEIDSLSLLETKGRYTFADNFEGITVKENIIDGTTAIFMVTDSNRAAFQEDLLLQFNVDNEVLGL